MCVNPYDRELLAGSRPTADSKPYRLSTVRTADVDRVTQLFGSVAGVRIPHISWGALRVAAGGSSRRHHLAANSPRPRATAGVHWR